MGTPEFLLACAVLFALVCVASSMLARRPPDPPLDPPAASRWRRLRVSPAVLQDESSSTAVVEEEGGEVELTVLEGTIELMPLVIGDASGEPLLRIDAQVLTFRPTLEVRLDGARWFEMRLKDGRGFPEIRPREGWLSKNPCPELALRNVELQGDLSRREYEIRLDAALVASVSFQRPEAPPDTASGRYWLEVVRSAPVVPIVALVVALEVAATAQGAGIPAGEPEPTLPEA